jgi:hypothetical protein
MASYRKIEVKPIAGALGAEIIGVDVKRVDEDTFAEVHAALARAPRRVLSRSDLDV